MAPEHKQPQIFIQANITMGKKLKSFQERPYLVSGRFMKWSCFIRQPPAQDNHFFMCQKYI